MSDQLPVVGGQLPVRCGCGGEANIYTYEARWKKTEDGYQRSVGCLKCGIATQLYDTEAEAVQAWNRAMGAKDINVPNKFATDTNVGDKERIAKVERYSFGETLTYDFDGQCECGKWVDALWDYCPSCGARLEWK